MYVETDLENPGWWIVVEVGYWNEAAKTQLAVPEKMGIGLASMGGGALMGGTTLVISHHLHSIVL